MPHYEFFSHDCKKSRQREADGHERDKKHPDQIELPDYKPSHK